MSLLFAAATLLIGAQAVAQDNSDLYRYRADELTHWASPENRQAAKGSGGLENKGAKNHAWDEIPAGTSYVLADIKGAGTIDRMWMTIDDRSPEVLRGLKLEIHWDGAATPSVSVPLGDFFLHGVGEMVAMDTALFSSGEGRSFVSYVPMPFRKSARLVLTNESAKKVNLFYDVDYRSVAAQPADGLYFHASWRRERATRIGEDFRIMPRIEGRGRFLGASIAVLTNPAYEKSWWGEGEVKVRLDGDRDHASLVGTGTEDYIGSAPKADVIRFQKAGVPLIPVSVDVGNRSGGFATLLTTRKPLTDPSLPDGWTNFYRSDDVAAVAYYYLDRPGGVLPAIAPAAERMSGLRHAPEKK